MSALRSFAEDRSFRFFLRIEAIAYGYEIGGLSEVIQWDVDWLVIADDLDGIVYEPIESAMREILDALSESDGSFQAP